METRNNVNDGDDVGTMFKLNDVVAKTMETIFDGDDIGTILKLRDEQEWNHRSIPG